MSWGAPPPVPAGARRRLLIGSSLFFFAPLCASLRLKGSLAKGSTVQEAFRQAMRDLDAERQPATVDPNSLRVIQAALANSPDADLPASGPVEELCFVAEKLGRQWATYTNPGRTQPQEKERLHELALQYGFSLEELLVRILREVSSGIPSESLKDYKNPKKLGLSLSRAICDYRDGHISPDL